MSDITANIEAITDELYRLEHPLEPRLEGDVDLFQLCKAWNMGEGSVRRRMKKVGKHSGVTGFVCLKVFDNERKHEVLVMRKVAKGV